MTPCASAITVAEEAPLDGSRRFKLSQRRFTIGLAAAAKAANDKTLWQVPIVAVTGSGAVHRFVMNSAEQTVSIPTTAGETEGAGKSWVKFNAGQTGFYRVDSTASTKNAAALTEALASNALEPLDRLGLISDAFAFAATSKDGGNKPPNAAGAALGLVAACSNEPDLYVWKELAGHLKTYISAFGDDAECGASNNAAPPRRRRPTPLPQMCSGTLNSSRS